MKSSAMKLAGRIGKIYKKSRRAVFVEVHSKDIMKGLQEVRKATERISDLSAYDTGKGQFEVMYRFCLGGSVLNIKTRVAADRPVLPTCTGLFPGALLFEREQHEMFGVHFSGHRGFGKVLHADSTPETPLRKDMAGKKEGMDA